MFHTAPVPSLLLGQDDWIFYTGEQSRPNWRGFLPFEESELQEWKRVLEERRDWLAQRNIGYLFTLAPNKETIYPERLPRSENKLGPTRREIFFAWMKTHSDVGVLDLAPAVLAERANDVPAEQDFAFNPLGTHWTNRAAWAAAELIAAELAQRYPAIEPARRSDWERIALDPSQQDSWGNNLLCEDLISEKVWGFFIHGESKAHPSLPNLDSGPGAERDYANPRPGLPAILLLHDSFGPPVEIPLAEHASRLITLWQHRFLKDRILLDHPDVVIELYTERTLTHPPQPNMLDGVPVEASVFDALERARPELDPAALLAAIQPFSDTQIHLEEEGRALAIVTAPNHDKVLLPAIEAPGERRLCVHMEIVSPEPTVLNFWYQTRDEPAYHHQRKISVALEAGPNKVCIRLPVVGLRGQLLMQPGWNHGRYVLRNFDMRW